MGPQRLLFLPAFSGSLLTVIAHITVSKAMQGIKRMNRQDRTIFHLVFAVIVGAALVGCSGSSGTDSSSIASNDQSVNPTTNPTNTPTNPIQQDPSACAFLWDTDITSPTELINTSAQCDYLLDGLVDIRSLLIIQPGVVIRATPNTILTLEGGEIQAIGNAQNRIVFEGLARTQGYWNGIVIDSGRNAVFDYVDIRDAGQVCAIVFCPDVAVIVDDIDFSFTNSSVSNSFVFGLSIGEDVNLQAFANNRFFGNGLNGLSVDHKHVPTLDVGTDYLGIDQPNGVVGISIQTGEQVLGEVFEWKRLNAPYYIGSFFTVSGGILILHPGVVLVFDEAAWMTIEGNGVFQSLGTAELPVVIRGYEARPGYWDGIRFNESFWTNNILQHTFVAHSGNTENLAPAFGGIRLDESQLRIQNSTFIDNAQWGISCTAPDFSDPQSIVSDTGGNTFDNNGAGSIDRDCSRL